MLPLQMRRAASGLGTTWPSLSDGVVSCLAGGGAYDGGEAEASPAQAALSGQLSRHANLAIEEEDDPKVVTARGDARMMMPTNQTET